MSAATRYRDFWTRVGAGFPDLGGALSTQYYADNERRLFREHLPLREGLTVLKTDLWDEARNTRILNWAATQGVHAYGIDISAPTITLARDGFPGTLRAARADVRQMPIADNSVDAVYSMGTIEHFDGTEDAVREIARVVKPGGRVIIGVPNLHDPFLRPLLVACLQAVGLYSYGVERAYSRRQLRHMIEDAGLVVEDETAILFIPGGLRMFDLACHAWCKPLARLSGLLVRPFMWLDAHVPAVRRHGYLLATVASKPARTC